ncbi:hypothetical protein AMJ82_08945 [candidate division TA06 bacterium SM23_40]|uniref:Right handed beta helix domain-containing protein n=1 Tax=candidate division TA06 bacterium SM23_40 TaxID=1703774 RepID=A0A0S8G561_UNCT6|nr:MAG: hypothetical protein AMJ82_08945 [candidate division TA06 bacterium SM23_40]
MPYLTSYGGIWGAIPQSQGRVFWVSAGDSCVVNGETYHASDNNDGLSPERPCRRVNHVIDNLVTANAGDVVVLLAGTHTLQNAAGTSTSLAMDTAGVTLMGLPCGQGNFLQQRTTIAAVTGDQNVNVTAANIEIAYLNFIPVTADTAIDISADGDNVHIHHCSFDLSTPAADTGTKGIEFIGAASYPLIHHIYAYCDGAQGPAIELGTINYGVVRDCIMVCTAGSWAAAMVTGAGGTTNLVENCIFLCDGTAITDAITGGASAAGAWTFRFCHFPVLCDELDGFTATHAELNQCYIATVGGGSGGTQVTPTT